MKQHVIPASVLSGVIDIAVNLQISIEGLLQQAGIDPALVGSKDAYLTAEQFSALLSALKTASADEAFGLHYGETIHHRGPSVVVDLLYSARTLREALRELVKYKQLVVPHAQVAMSVEGDQATIVYAPGGASLKENQTTHNEIILSRIVSICRWVTGNKFPLLEVRFSHLEPDYVDEYRRFFACPIVFNYPENQVIFKKNVLDLPLAGSLPDYHSRVEEQAAEQLEKLEAGYKITRRVIDYIEFNMGKSGIGIVDVAQSLNMTPRTLQRKLKLENTSFVELRDRLRHERAQRYLSQSSISISSLAVLLGFSDVSTFYHAFKRWEGMSPGDYRKQQAEPDLEALSLESRN